MSKKGELASYTVSYGWTFLFLMGIIVIIFSFSFFHFGLYENLKCSFSGDFLCKEPYIASNELSFVIQNQKEVPILLSTISLVEETCGSTVNLEKPILLQTREKYKVMFSCEEFPIVTKGDVIVEYVSQRTGLSFSDTGTIKFKLQPQVAKQREFKKIGDFIDRAKIS